MSYYLGAKFNAYLHSQHRCKICRRHFTTESLMRKDYPLCPKCHESAYGKRNDKKQD